MSGGIFDSHREHWVTGEHSIVPVLKECDLSVQYIEYPRRLIDHRAIGVQEE